MKHTLLAFVIVFASASAVYVQAEANIQFPVQELGGCKSESDCRAYCDNSANIERCLDFAEKNGLMSREELNEARKFSEIGAGPGGCTSKEICESYCENADNIKECIQFAERHGMMSGEELEEAKKILKALESGAKLPGGCTNENSCDAYCSNETNILECVAFAEAAGFISSDEAAMVKKTGGKGPGGCKGKECETFCQDPANGEICYNFALEYGLMDSEIEKGSREFVDALKNAPDEVKTCIESEFGDLSKVFPGPRTGEKLRECFETYGRENPGKAYWPAQEGEQQERTGPGGCRSREECDAYCRENPEACRPPEGATQDQYSGPMGAPPEGIMQYQPDGPTDVPPESMMQYQPDDSTQFQVPPEGMMRPPEDTSTGSMPPQDVMFQPQMIEQPSPSERISEPTPTAPAEQPTSMLKMFIANVLTSFSQLLTSW